MTTTLTTIKNNIEYGIAGLTPAGLALSQRKYVRASDYADWRDRPLSDIDRRFTVRLEADGGWKSFGTSTEHEATARMTIIIGHIKGQRIEDTMERRDTDLRQIVLEAQDPNNRPSSVWRIAFVPPIVTVDMDKWWESTIRFMVTFSEANP